jgi:hypothetical protein
LKRNDQHPGAQGRTAPDEERAYSQFRSAAEPPRPIASKVAAIERSKSRCGASTNAIRTRPLKRA